MCPRGSKTYIDSHSSDLIPYIVSPVVESQGANPDRYKGDHQSGHNRFQHGYFYVENDDDHYDFDSLVNSGERHKLLAAEAARTWLHREANQIVETIFRLDYPETAGFWNQLEFENVEEVGERIHFIFHEKRPGSATYNLLWTLRHNVNLGPDTWDCGDFGTVSNHLDGSILRVSLGHYGPRSVHQPDWDPPLLDQYNYLFCSENDNGIGLAAPSLLVFPCFVLVALCFCVRRSIANNE